MIELVQGSPEWLQALRETFTADFATGQLTRIAGKQRPDLLDRPAGYVDNYGYTRVSFLKRKYLRSHLIFALYHGRTPVGQLDHINRQRTDDRPDNLREVTHHQNMWNRTPAKRDLPMGVSLRDGKYEAKIMCRRKLYRLGRSTTVAEAEAAYQAKRRELFDVYA